MKQSSWECLAGLILTLDLATCIKLLSNSTDTKIWNLDSELQYAKSKIPVQASYQEIKGGWQCPTIKNTRSFECGCDIPYTLRCSGDVYGLEILSDKLRNSPFKISLLDCTLRNVTFLSNARIFENITLQGLVISSGEIKRIHKLAFAGLGAGLQALGLPNNKFLYVPKNSISFLTSLERLDLSSNKIKSLGSLDFFNLGNLSFLDLSDNEISTISSKAFGSLRKLTTLKLAGNRFGESLESLQLIGYCHNLRDLDLRANSITGALTSHLLPKLPLLETLNLERNLIKRIQNKALENFTHLKYLSFCHNQIDVLQDHAFYGLNNLEHLDLSYNGIVAVSSLSLQHLSNLKILDLTHNFLRALTLDLTLPMPSLQELRLAGNDISIVAKNALGNAKSLHSLLMNENPLSCDCSMRYFSQWLQGSKLPQNDLMTPTCATPQHLEGAPLVQVPTNSLICEVEDLINNIDVRRSEGVSRTNNLTNVRDLGEMIFLTNFHFSTDYGLILTWTVKLKYDYTCDAIFVYKEENIHEILIDDSTIRCESKVINGRNTVSVIVPSSSLLLLGESYRFCLVLVQQKLSKSEVEIGCSNIIKLQTDEKVAARGRLHALNQNVKFIATAPDIEKSNSSNIKLAESLHVTQNSSKTLSVENPYKVYETLNTNFLFILSLGILIVLIIGLFWVWSKFRKSMGCMSTVDTCYTPNRGENFADPEERNHYLKLQATTSL